MVGKVHARELILSDCYEKSALEVFGSHEMADRLLLGVQLAISTGGDCEDYPPAVRGRKDIRLAWRDPSPHCPRVKVYFRILNDNEAELLWVEKED